MIIGSGIRYGGMSAAMKYFLEAEDDLAIAHYLGQRVAEVMFQPGPELLQA